MLPSEFLSLSCMKMMLKWMFTKFLRHFSFNKTLSYLEDCIFEFEQRLPDNHHHHYLELGQCMSQSESDFLFHPSRLCNSSTPRIRSIPRQLKYQNISQRFKSISTGHGISDLIEQNFFVANLVSCSAMCAVAEFRIGNQEPINWHNLGAASLARPTVLTPKLNQWIGTTSGLKLTCKDRHMINVAQCLLCAPIRMTRRTHISDRRLFTFG